MKMTAAFAAILIAASAYAEKPAVDFDAGIDVSAILKEAKAAAKWTRRWCPPSTPGRAAPIPIA